MGTLMHLARYETAMGSNIIPLSLDEDKQVSDYRKHGSVVFPRNIIASESWFINSQMVEIFLFLGYNSVNKSP